MIDPSSSILLNGKSPHNYAYVHIENTIVGSGGRNRNCGRILTVGADSHRHKESEVALRHTDDNRLCRACSSRWVAREVKRAARRHEAYMKVWDKLISPIDLDLYGNRARGGLEPQSAHPGRPKHVIFSPPQEWAVRMSKSESGTRWMKRQFTALVKRIGIRGASVVYHNKRYTKKADYEWKLDIKRGDKYAEKWKGIWHWLKCLNRLNNNAYTYIAPHFHCVLYGWIPEAGKFYKMTESKETGNEGWIYKNKGELAKDEDLRRCLAYQLGHSAVVVRKGASGRRKYAFNSISFIGELYFVKVQLAYREKHCVVCPTCQDRDTEWAGWSQESKYNKDRIDDEFDFRWNLKDSERPPIQLSDEILYTIFTYRAWSKKFPDVVITIVEDNNPLKSKIIAEKVECENIHENHAYDHVSGKWLDQNGKIVPEQPQPITFQ